MAEKQRGDTVMPDQGTETLPPHFRWNYVAFLTDYVCFGIAFTFASMGSVLPAFVDQLTDSAPVIGLVSTVFNGGWLLPQLVFARMIHDKPRKKPYLLVGIVGRLMFWVIALALWMGLAGYPAAMLTLFFTCLGLFAVADSMASVSWFDILARAVPMSRRGRLIGTAQIVGGVAGIGVGALVTLILDQHPFATNYALLFTLAGIAFIPATLALLLIREPPPEEIASQKDAGEMRGWLRILASDVNFRRLIACRLLVGLMGLAGSFYVVHASDVLHLPERVVGTFVIAQTIGSIVASALLGAASERWGPRVAARLGSAAAAMAPLFALAAHLAGGGWLAQAYPFVFVMWGVVYSSWMLGFTNYMLEIAPDGLRPAYVGLGNTIMGALTLAPIAGGWLLEATSYTTLFGLTTVLVGMGFLLSLGLKPAQQAKAEATERNTSVHRDAQFACQGSSDLGSGP
jgi:MFS family permease